MTFIKEYPFKDFQNDIYYVSLCAKLYWVVLLGVFFKNTILPQCKQERFGVGGLVRGWNSGKHLDGDLCWKHKVMTFLGSVPSIVAGRVLCVKQAAFTTRQYHFLISW